MTESGVERIDTTQVPKHELWRRPITDYASFGTPDTVFLEGYGISALDVATGEERWSWTPTSDSTDLLGVVEGRAAIWDRPSVHIVDEETGDTEHSYSLLSDLETDAESTDLRYGQELSDPLLFVYDQELLLAQNIHGIGAYELLTGKELWGATRPQEALPELSESLSASQGRVIANWGSHVVAFDADSGEQLWVRAVEEAEEFASPKSGFVSGDVVFVSDAQSTIGSQVWDAATGESLWALDDNQAPFNLPYFDNHDNELLYVQELNSRGQTRQMTAYQPRTGEELWVKDIPESATPRVTSYGDFVVYFDQMGIVSVLDPTTGRASWTEELPAHQRFDPQVYVGNGFLAALGGDQRIYVLSVEDGHLFTTISTGSAAYLQIQGPGNVEVDANYVAVTTYRGDEPSELILYGDESMK